MWGSVAQAVTRALIGRKLYPPSPTEIALGVPIVDGAYPHAHILRYGKNAVPGTTDMTAALQAAVDVAFVDGLEVRAPAGDYGVTSVVKQWTSSDAGLRIRGDGLATRFIKIGATTTPVLDLGVTIAGTVSGYFEIDGVHIVGKAKAHDGIRATRLNRFVLRNSRIDGCDVGLNSAGSLIFSVYDSYLNGNNVGYKARKSNAIYANLTLFHGGTISGNSTHGVDLGECSGVHFFGTEVALNGTASDTATGGVVIRDTVDDEASHAVMSFNGCWLEANKGVAFKAEASNVHVALRETHILGSEGGRALDIGAVRHLTLENCSSPSVGDTWTIAATSCTIMGGYVHTLADTSTQRTHVSLTTSAGSQRFRTNRIDMDHAAADAFYQTDDSVVGGLAADTLFRKLGTGELAFRFGAGSVRMLRMSSTGVGFNGAAPQAKGNIAGSRANPEQALKNLLDYLHQRGDITNGTTA
jgi:hypothetical protein